MFKACVLGLLIAGSSSGFPGSELMDAPFVEAAIALELKEIGAAKPSDPAAQTDWRKRYGDAIKTHFARKGLMRPIASAAIDYMAGLAEQERSDEVAQFGEELANATKERWARAWALQMTAQLLEMSGGAKAAIGIAKKGLADPLLVDMKVTFTILLAQLLGNTGQAGEGIALLEGFQKSGPKGLDLMRIQLELGEMLLDAGRPKDALVALEPVLAYPEMKTRPGRPHLLAGRAHLAIAWTLAGEAAAAERKAGHALLDVVTSFARTAKDAPEGAAMSAHLTAADAYLDAGDVESARKQLGAMAAAFRGRREADIAEKKLKELEWVGKPAPAIAGPDLDGKPVKPASWAGKIVLLDFWATWCAPCRAELPNVLKVHKESKGKPFEIVSVSLDDPAQRVRLKPFVAKNGMDWIHIFDGKVWESPLCVAYDVHGIPATFLIDETGKIVRVGLRGEQLGRAVRSELDRLGKKPPGR